MDKKDKIELILNEINKRDLTAYELHKNTGLNESGLTRIINGSVKNPQIGTINILYEYLFENNSFSNSDDLVLKKDNVVFTANEVVEWIYRNKDRLPPLTFVLACFTGFYKVNFKKST